MLGTDGENLVVGKLLMVVRDELCGGGILFFGDQELQVLRVERLLLRIAGEPRAVLGDGDVSRHALGMDDAEDTLQGLPGALFRSRGKFLGRDGRSVCDQR